MTKIVVGVDGSEESRAALRWARHEAQLRKAELDVVHVWTYPYTGPRTTVTEPRELMELDAAKELEQMLSALPADEARGAAPNVTVHAHVREGNPADVLVQESKDADLLVVGSRGRGGFAALLLGSVSTAVTHHASCPVVVVRPD
jgi:nucleotide-binding universal stress UspA family protein